jgi:hypothetical protein
MANATIPVATVPISGGPSAGTVLPAAEATVLGANVGAQFVNNGAVVLRWVVGSGGVGSLSVAFQRTVEGQVPAPEVIAVANSGVYLIGPFSPTNHNDTNSLCYVTKTGTATLDSVGLYFLPGAAV